MKIVDRIGKMANVAGFRAFYDAPPRRLPIRGVQVSGDDQVDSYEAYMSAVMRQAIAKPEQRLDAVRGAKP